MTPRFSPSPACGRGSGEGQPCDSAKVGVDESPRDSSEIDQTACARFDSGEWVEATVCPRRAHRGDGKGEGPLRLWRRSPPAGAAVGLSPPRGERRRFTIPSTRPAPMAMVVNTSKAAVRRAARTSPTIRTDPHEGTHTDVPAASPKDGLEIGGTRLAPFSKPCRLSSARRTLLTGDSRADPAIAASNSREVERASCDVFAPSSAWSPLLLFGGACSSSLGSNPDGAVERLRKHHADLQSTRSSRRRNAPSAPRISAAFRSRRASGVIA